jgi:hypothetical protein
MQLGRSRGAGAEAWVAGATSFFPRRRSHNNFSRSQSRMKLMQLCTIGSKIFLCGSGFGLDRKKTSQNFKIDQVYKKNNFFAIFVNLNWEKLKTV